MKSGGWIAALVLLAGCAETVARTEGRDVVELTARDVARDAGDDGAIDEADDGGGEGTPDAGDANAPADAMIDDAAAGGADPATCARSPALANAETLRATFREATTQVTNCRLGTGRAYAVFGRVAVPPRHVLRVTANASFTPSLFDACDTLRCLDARYDGAGGTATFVNEGAEVREVVAALLSREPSTPITAQAVVSLEPAGFLCDTAPEVSANATLAFDPARSSIARSRCGAAERASVGYLRVRIPAGMEAVAEAAGASLRFVERCDPSACVPEGGRDRAASFNSGTSPSIATLEVSRGTGDGPFDVRLTFAAPSPADRCETAPDLRTLVDQVVDPTRTGVSADVCGVAVDPRWYRATVPPGHRLEISVRAATSGSVYSTRIALLNFCAAATCVAPTHSYESVADRFVIWDNDGDQPRDLRVAVSGAAAPWRVVGGVRPIPATARCATAPLLRDGVTWARVALREFGETVTACYRASGQIFRVRVPPSHRVEVSAIGAAQRSIAVRFFDGCPGGACLADSPNFGRDRATTGWTNGSAAEREVYVLVFERGSSGPLPPPEVSVTTSVRLPAPHGDCARAATIELGVPRTDFIGDAGPASATCASSETRALYYRVSVPAGRRLRLRWSSADEIWSGLVVMGSCDARPCLASASRDNLLQETQWTNSGDAARDVVVAAWTEGVSLGRITLTASLEVPATNGRCERARPVRPGDVLGDVREGDAVERALTCGGGLCAASLFYAIDVPIGRVLRVTAVDHRDRPARVSAYAACGATCLATSASGPLVWRNESASERVIVALTPGTEVPEVGYRITFAVE